jgi:lysophospholipase L1-like esterase
MLFAAEVTIRVCNIPTTGLPLRQVEIFDGTSYRPISIWGTSSLKTNSPFTEVAMGEYIPNTLFRFVYASNPRKYFDSANAVYARINNLGLRGEDISLEKPQNTYRILGVGDSVTFGEGVNDKDTYLVKLNNYLTKTYKRKSFQMINCGISGYNTKDEVIYLKNRWVGLQPDYAIIMFTMSDGYSDDVFADSALGPLATGLMNGTTQLPEGEREFKSKFLSWVINTINRKRTSDRLIDIYLSQYSKNPMLEGYNWENTKYYFALAHEILNDINCKMVIVIFPELFRINDNYPFKEIHEKIKAESKRQGIPVLDLLPAFQRYKTNELWVHPTDHHPNELAHEVMAQEILNFLKTNNGIH